MAAPKKILFSTTVNGIISELEKSKKSAFTAYDFFELLQVRHPEYSGSRMKDLEVIPEKGAKQRSIHDWISQITAIFRPDTISQIHGRLFLIGLVLEDVEFGRQLFDYDFLPNLLDELKPSLEESLLPEYYKKWVDFWKKSNIESSANNPSPEQKMDTPTVEPVGTFTQNHPDLPVTRSENDYLMREPLARALVERIKLVGQKYPGTFLMHVDGPWGSGKSTILNFIKLNLENKGKGKQNEDSWIVVEFNAWRNQRIQPPWWALMKKVSGTIRDHLHSHKYIRKSWGIWFHDKLWRIDFRRNWPTWLVFVLILGALIFLLTRNRVIEWKKQSGDQIEESVSYETSSNGDSTVTRANTIKLFTEDTLFETTSSLIQTFSNDSLPVLVETSAEKVEARSNSSLENGSVMENLDSFFKFILGLAALLGLLWGASSKLAKTLIFGSSKSAELFSQSNEDPTQSLKEHFQSIIKKTKPFNIAIFIDDLDRCTTEYGVQLLEGIQTMFKYEDTRLVYIIAADGKWLQTMYEKEYAPFYDTIKEPGKTLGMLFLEKTFQLNVTIPELSPSLKKSYWKHLLGIDPAKEEQSLSDAKERVAHTIEETSDREELLKMASQETEDPIFDRTLREKLVEEFSTPEAEIYREHRLAQYFHLLESNPRAMIRLVNAYGVDEVTNILSGIYLEEGPFTLWTILKMRFPLLANYLLKNPEKISYFYSKEETLDPTTFSDDPMLNNLILEEEVKNVIWGYDLEGIELRKEHLETLGFRREHLY